MTAARRNLHRVTAFVVAVLLSQSVLAFRSTNVESYSDPDYKDFKPKKVVIMVRNAPNEVRGQIEKRLIERLGDYGVTGIEERELFPPTREWTPDARAEILSRHGIDSSIVVVMGASSASIQNIGTQTFARTNVHGTINANASGIVNATATTNSTSHNLIMARSKADFSALLVDVKTARTAWYADITVKAAGTAFVSDKGDAKGAVKGVIEGLSDDGHIVK